MRCGAMLIRDPLFYAIAIPVVVLTGVSKTGIRASSAGWRFRGVWRERSLGKIVQLYGALLRA